MKEVIISRDKKNPTWAWVWDEGDKERKQKRIIIDIYYKGCFAVDGESPDNYMNNKYYTVNNWDHYEIIKEPVFTEQRFFSAC